MNLTFHRTANGISKKTGQPITRFQYFLDCSEDELETYKEIQGKYYREIDEIPLYSIPQFIGKNASLVFETGKDGKLYANYDNTEFAVLKQMITEHVNGDPVQVAKALSTFVSQIGASFLSVEDYLEQLSDASITSEDDNGQLVDDEF